MLTILPEKTSPPASGVDDGLTGGAGTAQDQGVPPPNPPSSPPPLPPEPDLQLERSKVAWLAYMTVQYLFWLLGAIRDLSSRKSP